MRPSDAALPRGLPHCGMSSEAPSFDVRKGQAPEALSREEFGQRFRLRFYDPAFDPEATFTVRGGSVASLVVSSEEKFNGDRAMPLAPVSTRK